MCWGHCAQRDCGGVDRPLTTRRVAGHRLLPPPLTQQAVAAKYAKPVKFRTTGFKAGMFNNTGFVTNRTTSKVHKHLDDF